MRAISIVAVALLVSAPVFAAQTGAVKAVPQFDAGKQCDEFSQAGRRECMTKIAADSVVTLKKAEDKAIQMINQWHEDANFKNLAKSKLRGSSTAFAAYREAKCAFDDALVGGAIGNAHEIIRLACIADTNNQRALELIYATKNLAPP